MNIFYSSIIILLLSCNTLLAQTQNVYKLKADEAFASFKFKSAIALYHFSDTTDKEVIERTAEAYKAIKDYKNAERWYQKQSLLISQPDHFLLNYAEILANNGKYELSGIYYKKYRDKHPGDKRALNLSTVHENSNNFYKDSLNWKLEFLSINTPKDEFAPAYFKRGLIFASNRNKRRGIRNIFGSNESPFTDLYFAEDTSKITHFSPQVYLNWANFPIAGAQKPRFAVSVNDSKVLRNDTYPKAVARSNKFKDTSGVHVLHGGLNTRFHDGPVSHAANQSYLLFNRNNRHSNSDGGQDIYKLSMLSLQYAGGTWYNLRPFEYNSVDYSVAHPAISQDGRLLYFVSDMPGGIGKKDIYYCTRESITNAWSKPVNLGPTFNTEGDETFPFLTADNVLYFSSDGYAGLGGLDIFYVKIKNDLPSGAATNMGYPLNSSKDDFGITLSPDNTSGYLSSDRYGSDDIFRFRHNKLTFKLEGKVFTDYAGGKRVLENVLVKVRHNNIVDSVYTDNMGHFSLNLDPETNYDIEAEKEAYTIDSNTATTIGLIRSVTLEMELHLNRLEQIKTTLKSRELANNNSLYDKRLRK